MPSEAFKSRSAAFRKYVESQIKIRMTEAGRVGVEAARELVPVKTGQTMIRIEYLYGRASKTLGIPARAPWAVLAEMGTSRVPARSLPRPGMIASGRALGGTGGTA
jgi:hypothetical protein